MYLCRLLASRRGPPGARAFTSDGARSNWMIPIIHELYGSIPMEVAFRSTKYVAPAVLRTRPRMYRATGRHIPPADAEIADSDWELHTTSDGYWYYYNPKTGQTRDGRIPDK